ncbi:MAG TPA: hypothetical protein VNX26_08940 [Candidatus Acidoferrum sp.]|jgi:hypothetical protein|nr:hypothetical protein [Candidatus Acidoferrum sp.]
MSKRQTSAIWAILAFGLFSVILTILLLHRRQPVTLRGAVLRQDKDPNKQLPIADVQITATNALGSGGSRSDATGFFSLKLPMGLRRRQQVVLQFRRKDYQPLDWNDFISDKIFVAHMVPINQDTSGDIRPGAKVSNTRIRYSVKATTEANIGSAVKTFQVINTGNAPCNKRPPCSPDGKWKAALGSLSLDAGEGNEFRSARVSCIAGPCPFTKVELENLSQERRRFSVSVRNWSDTTTMLLEAEVVRPMTSDMVRESYPVIFGRALNFSLPAAAEGPSIEAEIDGEAIVFPLGPDLRLRWAECHVGVDRDQSRTYRCELNPGYQFR